MRDHLIKLKVKELVEECGVNRNTFYYHYKDIYELLADILRLRQRKLLETLKNDDGTGRVFS